jgi:hypothetical protein
MPLRHIWRVEVEGNTLHSEINVLILFLIRRNYHNSGKNLLMYLHIKRMIKLTVVIIQGYHYQLHTFYLIFLFQG